MDDVVAVALVSAGSSLLGAAIGAFTTYKVSLRNTESTIATTEAQREVELAKVAAENERLQHSNREEERRNRQSTYHQFIEAAHMVFQRMGVRTSHSEIGEIGTTYRHLISGVFLFAPQSVRDGAHAINNIYQQIWPAMRQAEQENPEGSIEEHWQSCTAPLKENFGRAISDTVHLMHADVTRGIADDPE